MKSNNKIQKNELGYPVKLYAIANELINDDFDFRIHELDFVEVCNEKFAIYESEHNIYGAYFCEQKVPKHFCGNHRIYLTMEEARNRMMERLEEVEKELIARKNNLYSEIYQINEAIVTAQDRFAELSNELNLGIEEERLLNSQQKKQ
jgi:hypothetical protein